MIDWTNWQSDPYWSSSGLDWRPPWISPGHPTTIRWAQKRTVEPTVEPVTLEEAKLHLRVDFSDDDDLILDIISTARDYAEYFYGLAFLTQTRVLALDRWPNPGQIERWPWIAQPRGSILVLCQPIQTVSSVTWYTSDGIGNPHTLDSTTYEVGTFRNPSRIIPKKNSSWPNTDLMQLNSVQVTYVAGWTDRALVPRRFKQGLLLLIAHWYQNREAYVIDSTRMTKVEVPLAADALLSTALPPLVG